MDEYTRRVALAEVARHEVFVDLAGTDRHWVNGKADPLPPAARDALRELEAEELVTLPEFPDARRGERYWELTDAALKS